jgi:hypothetical protein
MRSRSIRAVLAAAMASVASAAFGQFVEPGVGLIATLSDPDGAPGLFGWAVADLDDINGDGVTDVITCAPAYGIEGAPALGRVYVFSGADGAMLHVWTGPLNSQMGFSVADAGDVDMDGVLDVIAGANLTENRGSAMIFSGATGALLRTLNGVNAGDNFGASVAGLGDINGDGASDVAVGAILHDVGATNSGRIYVFSGANGALIRTHDGPPMTGSQLGSGLSGAGDIDHDGVNDYIGGARGGQPSDRGRAFVWSGATGALLLPQLTPDPLTGQDLGWFFVAGAGDVNGDGTPDLYAGDFSDGGGHGAAYVFSGADASLIRKYTSPVPFGGVGPGRGAGDVNDDGYADQIIGHYTTSVGAANAGRVVVYSGKDGAVLRVITSTTGNEQLGFDCVGLGDVDGDCAIDYVVSAANGERVYIIAGNFPTLRGDSDNNGVVDFGDVNSTLSNWLGNYAPGTGPGDGNRNGLVDFDDIVETLARWGEVCGE